MSVIHRCLSVALAGSLLLGTSAGVAAEGVTPVTDPPPEHVLFIGNSHTARNGGLDWLMANIVYAADPEQPFRGHAHTQGGVGLQYHYENGAIEAIRTGDWDAVVLQGYLQQSRDHTIDAFLEYGRRLGEEVRAAGAEPVFFMTWKQGRHDWPELDDLVASHRRIEADLGARVAPVGVAFANALAERPDLVLLSDDEIHASWEGAYLAAVTIYATLFGRDPQGLPWAFGIDDETAAFLQRIAWQTLSDWQAGIPAAS